MTLHKGIGKNCSQGKHSVLIHRNIEAFLWEAPISLCDVYIDSCKRFLFTLCTKQYSKQTNITDVFMIPGVKSLYDTRIKRQEILHIFLAYFKLFLESTIKSGMGCFPRPEFWYKVPTFFHHTKYPRFSSILFAIFPDFSNCIEKCCQFILL